VEELMMLQLRGLVDGADRTFPLTGEQVRIGRGPDNEVRLSDPSVSRHHAVVERGREGWMIRDLGSTNGTRLNGERVERAPLGAGGTVQIGAFTLTVEDANGGGARGEAWGRPEQAALEQIENTAVTDPPVADGSPPSGEGPSRPSPESSRIPNASIVRPLRDFTSAYGLEGKSPPPAAAPSGEASEVAYGDRVFGFLTRLAQLLIEAEEVSEVLERVLSIAFEALPVERGFILLQDHRGDPVCELARFGEEIVHRPKEGVPVSRTILEAVMEDRLALLTYDAQVDDRLAVGDSIRIHGIRAAMSAPLWSGERIIGVIQVDSPVQAGAFTERDLDFLTALANYAAVAVERLRHARQVEVERWVRSRFERYHSPAVIEEMLRETETAAAVELAVDDAGLRKPRSTEATVLFADLVGFTAFAERLDPEEVADLLGGYFNHAVEAIFAAGGTLDKFIGDAVMAFFGPPYDDPDHASKAVGAAIEIRRRVGAWNRERRARDLSTLDLRIAVNSGPVVVGDVGSDRRVDYTVLGNTVNVAARLEQFVAGPGEIVIGPETERLLAGEVPVEDLGDVNLKGLEEKVHVYRVSGSVERMVRPPEQRAE
jgi:adenylate cyclase